VSAFLGGKSETGQNSRTRGVFLRQKGKGQKKAPTRAAGGGKHNCFIKEKPKVLKINPSSKGLNLRWRYLLESRVKVSDENPFQGGCPSKAVFYRVKIVVVVTGLLVYLEEGEDVLRGWRLGRNVSERGANLTSSKTDLTS